MKTRQIAQTIPKIAMSLLLIAALACSSDPVSPGSQPEIVNAVDNFAFQVTGMQNYTGSRSYKWTTTASIANVDQSTAITGGLATLTIRDSQGTEIYSRALNADGTYPTVSGASGDWTLELQFKKTTGTLNFRVQKKQ